MENVPEKLQENIGNVFEMENVSEKKLQENIGNVFEMENVSV